MDKNTKLIISCLAAAAAGVAIGMLIAPEEGSKFRANLKDFASKLVNRLAEDGSSLAESATDGVNEASTDATEIS